MLHPLDKLILDLLANGAKRTREIIAGVGEEHARAVKRRLGLLKNRGEIEMPTRSLYRISTSDTKSGNPVSSSSSSEQLRTAEDNEETIDTMLNLFDQHLKSYKAWAEVNIGVRTDFEEHLACIDNFKVLAMIVDKLLKRWSLVHIGYENNTQLAKEDAKQKTQQKEADRLKDAPIQDRVRVVASYDLEAKKFIDAIPGLDSMDEEDTKKAKV